MIIGDWQNVSNSNRQFRKHRHASRKQLEIYDYFVVREGRFSGTGLSVESAGADLTRKIAYSNSRGFSKRIS